MSKKTKRRSKISKQVDSKKIYDVNQAIDILKKTATAKFNESIDIAINLGINTKKSEQNIRGTVLLPNGTGKKIKIGVFAKDLDIKKAKLAGANYIGMENLIKKIKDKKNLLDVIIASPDAMKIVGTIGSILGPRGIMPSPKLGTVTNNIYQTIKNVKKGQIYFKNDKNGIIHSIIGKINFQKEHIVENLKVLLKAINQMKSEKSKGVFFKKVTISTTMGISVNINYLNL
ncbi:50S ribosomal protein L1 [Buchnera aphidicola (Neophyllaphis varicolor)]|uniref:50S ribosomal protein L1 n=1 Tax=Buchnera aphidicola TaxID=9 RepID=UPI0031B7EC42